MNLLTLLSPGEKAAVLICLAVALFCLVMAVVETIRIWRLE